MDNVWQVYEEAKRVLREQNLSAEEYERKVREIVEELGL